MKKTYGREHRAMTLGDDTTGGYLAPELWETRLYQNLPKHARRPQELHADRHDGPRDHPPAEADRRA